MDSVFQKKRQKKLEAKKIQEQIEEEERKQIEIEETKFKEQKQRETVEKARTQLYHQTSQVRRLHVSVKHFTRYTSWKFDESTNCYFLPQSALLLSEVLKQREAQTELKQQMQSASEDVDKKFLETVKTKQDEALKQEQEKALHMKLQRQAAAEDLKNQYDFLFLLFYELLLILGAWPRQRGISVCKCKFVFTVSNNLMRKTLIAINKVLTWTEIKLSTVRKKSNFVLG